MTKKKVFPILTVYITFFILIILTTSLVAGIVFYKTMVNRAFLRVQRDDAWLVSQLCSSVSYLFSNADNVSSSLAFDSEIQSMLIMYAYGDKVRPDIEETRLKINSSIVEKGRFNKAIYECINIVIFSNEGTVLGSKEVYDMYANMFSYPWAEEVKNSKGKSIWLPLSVDLNSPATKNILSIPVVRKIFSTQSSSSNTFEENLTVGKSLGYLLIYFDSAMFSDIVSEYSRTAKEFYFVDGNDIIISSKRHSDIGKAFSVKELPSGYVEFEGKEYLMTKMSQPNSDWSYICLTYRSEIERDGGLILSVCLFLSLLLLAAFIILGLLLSRLTTKPVAFLIDSFKKAETGKVKIEKETSIKEFEDLYNSFNNTMDKIHELANEVYKSQLEKQELAITAKKSHIQSLQNQINPHFLYNTLDSINWKARMDGDLEVSEMICTLGKFFRSNIRISENEIPLKTELENVGLYVELSKYRFGDRLHYEVYCDEEVKDIKVLRLLFQPLIENSIKHGIEQTGEEEHISIKVCKEGNRVKINIKDDGPGMDEDTLSYLRQLWEFAGLEYHKETRSIGLYNIFRRLSLTYYGDVSLQINSSCDVGTEFIISIPMKKSE